MRDEEILEARFDPTCVTSKRASTSEEHSKRLDIALECINLTTVYGEEEVLRGLDLAVPSGSSYAVTGPAGSGKTSLFKAVVGLVPVSAGKIHIFGRPAANQKQFVAFMPSWRSINWDFPLTLLDFVMLGVYPKLGLMARPVGRFRQDAYSALKKMSLYEFKDKQINSLSTALRQRALAARMLAQETEVYLLDDPFTGVDAESAGILTEALHTLKENSKTVLAALRDLNGVEGCFDKALLLNEGRAAELKTEARAPSVSAVEEREDETPPQATPPLAPAVSNFVCSPVFLESLRLLEKSRSFEAAVQPPDYPAEEVAPIQISSTVPAPALADDTVPYTPSFEEIASGISEDGFFEEDGGDTAISFADAPVYEITPEEFDDAAGEYREGVFIPAPHGEKPSYNLDAGLSETADIPEEEADDLREEELPPPVAAIAIAEAEAKEEAPPEYTPPQWLDTEINPVFEIFSGLEHEEQPHDTSSNPKEQDVWSKITEFTRSMGKKKRGR